MWYKYREFTLLFYNECKKTEYDALKSYVALILRGKRTPCIHPQCGWDKTRKVL